MNRRRFGRRIATSGAILGVAGATSHCAFARDEPIAPNTLPLEFDKPIALSVQSAGVSWRVTTYHLVSLNQIQFSHDRDAGRVTAKIRAAVVTFDRVDYEVSGAVFGPAGRLLAVAKTTCTVERNWIGKPLHMRKDLSLDFGSSLDFAVAERFSLAINRRTVRTPDQWERTAS
jgi:hypothetical protein